MNIFINNFYIKMGNTCKNFNEGEESKISISKDDSPRDKIKNKDIEILKKKVMNIPIFKRKDIAKKNYNKIISDRNNNMKIKNKEAFMKKYLSIIELVLLNNTDKDIISLYLNFIKENDLYVKIYDFERFDKEIKVYKILFTKEEAERFKKGIKLQSEKDILLNFLTELSNIADDNDNINENSINKIFAKVENEKKQIIYFNYPINFSNQELYFYKIFILLIIQISKAQKLDEGKKKKYIINKSNVAKIILNNKVLQNPKIINSEDKMNILVLLILFENLDKQKSSLNFNRLLHQEEISYSELKKHIIDNNLGKIKEEKEYIYLENEPGIFYQLYPNEICIKNLTKSSLNSIINMIEVDHFKTLEKLLEKNSITPYIEKLKNFLLKIVDSRVYKEAIEELFPDYHTNLLGINLDDIKECIKSRIKYYPYQRLENSGLTDKLSSILFIPVFLNVSAPLIFRPILKCGALIENTMHELNHLNQNIIYFRGNDKSLFYTPKREWLKEEDGGENTEEILFGDKIEMLKLLESFYILNELNYEQSLNDFRKNFQNFTNNNVDFSKKMKFIKCYKDDAIFKEFFEIIKDLDEKTIVENELSWVSTKSEADEFQNCFAYIPKGVCKYP